MRSFFVWCALYFLVVTAQAMPSNPMAIAWPLAEHHWQQFETAHFIVVYRQDHVNQAERAAGFAERAFDQLNQTLQWQPKHRIYLVLSDDVDMANGWAHTLPFNQIRLFLSPPDGDTGLEYYDDWLNYLILHELTHVLHLDMAYGWPAALRRVFGRLPLTMPHQFNPLFLIEGLAVYQETHHEQGVGRGQGERYRMRMAAEVANGIDDLAQITTPLRDWPLDKAYLYGYFYVAFLVDQFGEDALIHYLQRYARNLIPYAWLNADAKAVFGATHTDLWPRFQEWVAHHVQTPANQTPSFPLHSLTVSDAQMNVTASTRDGDHYLYVRNNGQDRLTLMRVTEAQASESMTALRGALDLDINDHGEWVYTRLVPTADGRALSIPFLRSQQQEIALAPLTADTPRYRQVRWQGRDGPLLIARSIVDGISQLHLIDRSGQPIRMLWRGSLDDVLGEFDVSTSGQFLIASIKRAHQGWNLERFDLVGDDGWHTLTNTKAIELNPRISDDEGSVLYSANYHDRYQIQRLSLADQTVQTLTHEPWGAFKPVPVGQQLYYQRYTAHGYEHVQQVLDSTPVAASQSILSWQGAHDYRYLDDNQVDTSSPRRYSPWSSLRPTSWLPIWNSTPDYQQLGVALNGADALGRHAYQLTALYDSDNALLDGQLQWDWDNRWQWIGQQEHRYFVNAEQQVTGVRRSRTVELNRRALWRRMEDNVQLSVALQHKDNQDLTHQNWQARYLDHKSTRIGARLQYHYLEQYALSLAPSWGTSAFVQWEQDLGISGQDRIERALGHMSHHVDLRGRRTLALSLNAAIAWDDDPLRLGGTESLLSQPMLGQDRWALRSYREDVQWGNRLVSSAIEYRFPLLSIERGWNIWPLGLGDVSANVFAETGSAWQQGHSPSPRHGVGVELMLEVVLGYQMVLPVRLGYAQGLNEEGGARSYVTLNYRF